MPVPRGSQAPSRSFDARILEQLACPVCFGGLRLLTTGAAIGCTGCQRLYPLIDGIPVLIPERAAAKEA